MAAVAVQNALQIDLADALQVADKEGILGRVRRRSRGGAIRL